MKHKLNKNLCFHIRVFSSIWDEKKKQMILLKG